MGVRGAVAFHGNLLTESGQPYEWRKFFGFLQQEQARIIGAAGRPHFPADEVVSNLQKVQSTNRELVFEKTKNKINWTRAKTGRKKNKLSLDVSGSNESNGTSRSKA
jgi:hypothetical protein